MNREEQLQEEESERRRLLDEIDQTYDRVIVEEFGTEALAKIRNDSERFELYKRAITKKVDFLTGEIRKKFYEEPRQWLAPARSTSREVLGLLPPVQPSQTVAIAPACPKVAALAFDRVWCLDLEAWDAGEQVPFFAGTQAEVEFAALVAVCQFRPGLMCSIEDLMRFTGHEPYSPLASPNLSSTMGAVENSVAEQERVVAAQALGAIIEGKLQRSVPVVFPTAASRSLAYRPGSSETIVGVLADLEIVDETAASWEQVIDFREDDESRRKYRRFVHWLEKEMVGKSSSYILDEISERLEDYERAIRKHGFKTVLGSISSVLDSRTLIAGAVTAAGVAVATDDFVAALTAVGVIAGRSALHVSREWLELRDKVVTTNPEIAFVHDAKGRLGTL